MKRIAFSVSDRVYRKVAKLPYKKLVSLNRALRRLVNACIRI